MTIAPARRRLAASTPAPTPHRRSSPCWSSRDGAAWLPRARRPRRADRRARPARRRRRRVHATPAPTSWRRPTALSRAPFQVTVLQADRGTAFGACRGAGRGTAARRTAPSPTPAVGLAAARRQRGRADALERLLSGRRSPSVGVAGPKLVTWATTGACSRSACRSPAPDARRAAGGGEADQGQHDRRTDVLAVRARACSCAATSATTSAASTRPSRRTRADLDFCWRAHLAGHRVVVVPRRRSVTPRQLRAPSAPGRRPPARQPTGGAAPSGRPGPVLAARRALLALWILCRARPRLAAPPAKRPRAPGPS